MELLGIGRKLADKIGQKLTLLLMGSKIGDLGQEAIACGADKVYIADNPLLEQYNSDAYTLVATDLCRKVQPYILLLGQTDIGRDLAPRIAGRLQGGLATDAVELDIDPETKLLVATRPVFGGNALAAVISRSARPQIATIRAKTVKPTERDASRQGQIIPLEATVDPSAIKVKVIERVEEKVEGVKLEDAEVVVSGGRGIGSLQNFAMIWELAKLLDGAVGSTRPACEEGWIPTTHQVGQTGKMVSPKLYIAVALSGAMQHISGCSGSKCIVAINQDPEANIFRVAHYGIIGDYKKILPPFIGKLKELLAK
jgi:electron transfer flavoprotein alpha subunit